MRRVALAIVSGLMIVALIAPVASAARPAPSFWAHSSAAAPGGSLKVIAKVVHWTRGIDFSATVTVTFADGPMTVALNRRGHSFVAGGKVSVPADQPLGTVPVEVVITYDGVAQTPIDFNAQIVADTGD